MNRNGGNRLDNRIRSRTMKRIAIALMMGVGLARAADSNKFKNFRDSDGRSAVPYLLVFKTKK